ncbi:Dachshund-like protein 1 [Microtus ochrogaster]|uniref:Dachshund-like protein 1 n=1 Tax=Microtus ochrogaster TaxID=79684 RepID=A0A8J6GCM9_MICOH|nr:Dachshund-like protein 1 [Microtus ochrogaster]
MVDLRGAKVASFTVEGCELICLPQAFDLFLKHLVGGLHTVYTKLKRLEITPVVCNVEQVRILRGLGAIQPGVNRCKLISRKDFETLYNDCTNASLWAPIGEEGGRDPKLTAFGSGGMRSGVGGTLERKEGGLAAKSGAEKSLGEQYLGLKEEQG